MKFFDKSGKELRNITIECTAYESILLLALVARRAGLPLQSAISELMRWFCCSETEIQAEANRAHEADLASDPAIFQ